MNKLILSVIAIAMAFVTLAGFSHAMSGDNFTCTPSKLITRGELILKSDPEKAVELFRDALCASYGTDNLNWASAYAFQGLSNAYLKQGKYSTSIYFAKWAVEISRQASASYIDKKRIYSMKAIEEEMVSQIHSTQLLATNTPTNKDDLSLVFSAKNICRDNRCGGSRGTRGMDFSAIKTQADIYIHFDTNQDTPNYDGMQSVRKLAETLPHTSQKITIIGHTDARGTDEYNLALSRRRAISVKNTLVDRYGFEEDRLIAIGKGESARVSFGSTAENHRMNRRVNVVTE